jgi:hypothetical protein
MNNLTKSEKRYINIITVISTIGLVWCIVKLVIHYEG